jgi:hypothetical protein
MMSCHELSYRKNMRSETRKNKTIDLLALVKCDTDELSHYRKMRSETRKHMKIDPLAFIKCDATRCIL